MRAYQRPGWQDPPKKDPGPDFKDCKTFTYDKRFTDEYTRVEDVVKNKDDPRNWPNESARHTPYVPRRED